MGFLFFADILGTKSLLKYDPDIAESFFARFANEAELASKQVSGQKAKDGSRPDAQLVVLNDSVYFYSSNMKTAIRFGVILAQSMVLVHEPDGGPAVIRGGIGPCSAAPKVHQRSEGGRSVLQVASAAIPGALVAETTKVSGSRILVPKALLDQDLYCTWAPRDQAKLTYFAAERGFVRSSSLTSALPIRDHCDVLWMNADSNDRFHRIKEAILNQIYLSLPDPNVTRHAAANATLLRATELRRHGLVVVLKQLRAGFLNHVQKPDRRDYEAWLRLAPRIAAAMRAAGREFFFPINYTGKLPALLKRNRFATH